jgi:enamine deaminase RidA (YjgF/YER057c/UK114 family)
MAARTRATGNTFSPPGQLKGASIMTTNSTSAEDRLGKLGIHLPDAPAPFGAYVPAVQTGNLLFLSGMLATSGHSVMAVGVVGKDLDVKAGREAAYTAALNVLALTKKQLGSLNRVSRVVRLGVYVVATPEFTEHPKIADAASELLEMSSATSPFLRASSLVSRVFHSVRRSNWKSSSK